MEVKSRFQRSFLIFENEDSGYEAGQKPSGYIKIEVREGKGRLWVSVQGLREPDDRFSYEVYLLKTAAARFTMTKIGKLLPGSNGYSFDLAFDPLNVAGTGLRTEDFNAAAIIVKFRDSKMKTVVCPLAAYRDSRTDWRSNAAKKLFENENRQDKSIEDEKIRDERISNEKISNENINDENITKDERFGDSFQSTEAVGSIEKSESEVKQKEFENETAKNDNMGQQRKSAYDNINTGCMYMNGNMCGMHLKGGEANPCAGCRAYNNTQGHEKMDLKPGNIERLKELLENNFERSDPFNSHRSDYKWWKVTNPVNLNNILYECGIRSPLLFNPVVMMSHYKYRHLIIGIFSDKQLRQEYLVSGVPGMHMVDKKPFSDMCRWVQLEGNRPVYGAFGYWLVYIDPKSGKLLNIQ